MNEQEPYSIEWHKGFQMGLYSGKTSERERIIKLIENGSAGCDGEGAHYYCGPICDIDKLIALIKGENK